MVLSGSVHARRQSCICIPLVAAHHLAGAHCPRLMMEILVGEVPRLAIKERVEHLVDEWDGRRVVNGRCTPSHNGFKSPALKAWVAHPEHSDPTYRPCPRQRPRIVYRAHEKEMASNMHHCCMGRSSSERSHPTQLLCIVVLCVLPTCTPGLCYLSHA